jgi:hypothetical protein
VLLLNDLSLDAGHWGSACSYPGTFFYIASPNRRSFATIVKYHSATKRCAWYLL